MENDNFVSLDKWEVLEEKLEKLDMYDRSTILFGLLGWLECNADLFKAINEGLNDLNRATYIKRKSNTLDMVY